MNQKSFSIAMLASMALCVMGPMVGLSRAAMPAHQFTVRIENVSNENTLKPSNGAKVAIGLSPGVWLIHGKGEPLFTSGKPDRGKGLESLAEDGDTSALAQSLREQAGVISSGVFNTPVGASAPGDIGPGQAFEFTVSAAPGTWLSFATMLAQSNDLFYAPGSHGIALFAKGRPISRNITSKILLWDAGTEVNEEPGIGPNQAPLQPAPHTGPREHGVVQPISKVHDGFHYPGVSEVIRVTITPLQQTAR